MKKILLSLGILIISSQTVFAQRAKLETGVKGGLNMSTISGAQPQDFKPSFHFGAFVETPFSFYKKFSVTFELQYSMQGYKGKEYQQYDALTFAPTSIIKLDDVTTHNLYVPITFNYYIGKSFAINVGAQVGYMFDASGSFDVNKANPSREYLNYADTSLDSYLFEQGYRSTEFKDYYEQLDYGVIAGFTYDINPNLFISGRYYLGLQDIYKKDNDYKSLAPPDNTDGSIPQEVYDRLVQQLNFYNKHLKFDPITNSVIQVSVGYKF